MNKQAKSVIYILISSVFFALMSILIRLAGDIPTMQKCFFRNLFASSFILFIAFRNGVRFELKKEHFPCHFMRVVLGAVGYICNFYTVDHMSIADANVLTKLSPFFVILMSVPVLKEKPSKMDIGAVVMAFVGLLFVVRPTFDSEMIPGLIGVLGGFGAGVAYTYVRKLRQLGVHTTQIVFEFFSFTCLVSLPFVIADFHPMNVSQILCLAAAGAAATLAQIMLTMAYSLAPGKKISVYEYSQILFAAAFAFLILHEAPAAHSWLGYAIIIGAAVFKWWHDNRKHTDENLAV